MPETIGLDIGSHSIKLVGLKMTSRGPFLARAGIKSIPSGVDREDLSQIAEIIKALFDEAGVKPGKVRLTVSGSGVNIRQITIASMPKAELKEALRWEIKGHLPFPIETARIDFQVLGQSVVDGVKKVDLIVVACPNHLIDRTLSIAREAGLDPAHLDVVPFALWNALLVWDRLKQEETIALIDFGAAKLGIHFFKDGILQFSRETTPAGTEITSAIMEGVRFEGDSNLFYQRAERIKEEVGIPSETEGETVVEESIKLSKISILIRPVLERITAEISRSLDYYRSQFNVDRIDRLLLTGGGADLKNISSYLGGELRLPVDHFSPVGETLFDSKKVDLTVLDQQGSVFTVAAGTALIQPKRIELLPAKESFISRIPIAKCIPVLAPAITLLIFIWFVWSMSGQVTTIQKERDAKMTKVPSIEKLQAMIPLLKEKEVQMKQELSLFPASMLAPVPYRDILKEISRIVPNNLTLTLLSTQSKAKTAKKEAQTAKPQEGESQKEEAREIYISGLVFGNDLQCLTALAQMIEGLEKSPLFRNPRLVSSDENRSYNQPGADFKIVSEIAVGSPPSPVSPPAAPFSKGGEGGRLKGVGRSGEERP